MIRILIDELGDGHGDIFLKVDAMPSFFQIADLYYMADFLELEENNPIVIGAAYINYFLSFVDKLGSAPEFITFDLSDQYIGGLLMSKLNKGLVETQYVVSDKTFGFEATCQGMDVLIKKRNPEFESERNWRLSEASIVEGLNWSLEKVRQHS